MSSTEKWLEKYDNVWININKKSIFLTYLNSLHNSDNCILAFIEYGNKIKHFMKIYNWKIEIVDIENIKNCLYILLTCIVSFGKHKYNKNSDKIYQESRDLFKKKIMIMVMLLWII